MTTSCLSSHQNSSQSCRSIPISSVLLDKLLMSSSIISDSVKSTKSNEIKSSECKLKRSLEYGSTQSKLSSSIRFTPPQVYKINRTVQNSKSEERNSSKVSSKYISPSSSASVTPPTLRSPKSKTSEMRTPIIWDDTNLASSKVRSSTRSSESESLSNGTPESSIFITPESTPKSIEVVRPRFKRSLSDHFEDGNSTVELSQNSSAYFTPDSSPGEYGSSVKRFKTKQNESSSSFCDGDRRYSSSYHSDERYSNGSWSSSSPSLHKSFYEPALVGYQLVGDSQFCRFGQQLLGLRRVSMPNSPGRIGICVSGQTITDLHKRVKEHFYPISDKIILMIGTNDFLRNSDVSTMCKELSALIETLQETVSNIVLLTLPPIPKLEKRHSSRHFALLEKYNSYIRGLENGDNIRIADVSRLYMSSAPYQKCRMHLFELFFSGPARRPDLIHLNRQGLELIRKYTASCSYGLGLLFCPLEMRNNYLRKLKKR
uniref:OSK domain-containing protein n=1 Tax=Cuerna arida TaxID=1464854 RepID=A0A1B6GU81_9HEMI